MLTTIRKSVADRCRLSTVSGTLHRHSPHTPGQEVQDGQVLTSKSVVKPVGSDLHHSDGQVSQTAHETIATVFFLANWSRKDQPWITL